jgi:mannose-6-phosphate isomerase-like protein (cupin superfamily)
MPPGTQERPHRHGRSRQFFYVLEGVLTMRTDGGLEAVSGGEGIEIAPGVVHQAVNQSAGDVRFLVVSSPPSHGDRVDM